MAETVLKVPQMIACFDTFPSVKLHVQEAHFDRLLALREHCDVLAPVLITCAEQPCPHLRAGRVKRRSLQTRYLPTARRSATSDFDAYQIA